MQGIHRTFSGRPRCDGSLRGRLKQRQAGGELVGLSSGRVGCQVLTQNLTMEDHVLLPANAPRKEGIWSLGGSMLNMLLILAARGPMGASNVWPSALLTGTTAGWPWSRRVTRTPRSSSDGTIHPFRSSSPSWVTPPLTGWRWIELAWTGLGVKFVDW